MNHAPRIFAIAALFILLLPAPCLAATQRIEFTAAGDFSEQAVRSGVKATREQCDRVPNAVWADAGKYGAECIKYWASGLGPAPVKRVIAFFHGDVWVGVGKTSKVYLALTNDKLRRDADDWARRLNFPYIFVGRPGTHGSSGDHMQRRRIAESRLISVALDAIKKKYGIEELVVAGQSGGGHVTSSLLTERADIVCAVPTSAPSSPRMRWEMRHMTRDDTGYKDSYEPVDHVNKAAMHPQVRVFVLGSPADINVLWPSQTMMYDALRSANVPVELLEGTGTGPAGHGLANSSRVVAGWCASGMSTQEIVRRARLGLKG